jgi:hypothetical protein
MADKLASCQVWFKGGTAPRSLLVIHRSVASQQPEALTLSPEHLETGRIDLRRRKDAEDLEQALRAASESLQ